MALCDELRDLVMAGVRWELSGDEIDVPTPGAAPMSGRTPTTIVPPISPVIAVSPDVASAMAMRPVDMDSLIRMIGQFNHPLRGGAANVVLPHIAPISNGLVCVTDIPSSDDDACGQIMSGAAGELLDKMLGALGMSRANVSIVPLLFWRTPGGRGATDEEMALARPFVRRVLQMLQPRVVLTMGATAAAEIGDINLARAHGVPVCKDEYTVLPIYHPNYMMLKPASKRDVWSALQQIEKLLQGA